MKDPDGLPRLSNLTLISYGTISMVMALAVVPVGAVLPTLYAQHARVTVAAAGTVLLIRSIYDALSDQVIGFLSDRTRTRLGARVPWIMGGGVVMLVGMTALFRIPAAAGVSYFAFWIVVFFTGSTMIGIPHYAWGSELSPDYQERARVFGFKGFMDNGGTLLFAIFPIALASFGILQTTDYTPEAVRLLGLIVVVVMPLSIVAAIALVPIGHADGSPRTSLRGLVESVMGNRPFQRFIAAYIIAGTGYGVFVALVFPFISTYLKIGHAFPHIVAVTGVSSLVSIPFWVRVVYWLGKHRAWALGWIANSLVLVPLIWVEPGESAVVPTAILMGLYGFTNGVSAVAPFAILSDVVDYDILKTGVDRGGNYFAFMMLAVKLLGSTGGLALVVLGGLFGYEMAEGVVNTGLADLGMLVMFIGAPGLFQLASVPLIWNFPIDERRQVIIRRRLERLGRAPSGAADGE